MVPINQLTVRNKPLSDESFTSYLLRLAKLNDIKIIPFLNFIKKENILYFQKDYFRLLDFMPSTKLDINKLCMLTNNSQNQLISCSFQLFLNSIGINNSNSRVKIMEGKINNHYSFCTTCIKTYGYHKLIWQIKDVKVCLEHEQLLSQACTKCDKEILVKDMELVNICPYCNFDLSNSNSSNITITNKETWIHEFWTYFLKGVHKPVTTSQIAIKLLYLLSNYAEEFEKKRINGDKEIINKIPALLQHARNSFSKTRSMHLGFLQEVLYKKGLNLKEFLEIIVPYRFSNSILQKRELKQTQAFCHAPWCEHYNQQGKLVKSSSNFREKKGNVKQYYYMYCPCCYCEYAYDEKGLLIERTYFIEGYYLLKNNYISLKELANESKLSLDQIKRCIAYFTTLKIYDLNLGHFNINKQLLSKFISSLKSGVKIKEIEKWKDWKSYTEFLAYRYHSSVLSLMKKTTSVRKELM
jgi:hypothetical protein